MSWTQEVPEAGSRELLGVADAMPQGGDHANTTGAKPPQDQSFPGQTELEAAIAHFRGGSIGAPQKYVRPFTRQLKTDTALRFPIDKVFFDRADSVQKQVIGSYWRLRITTLFFYCVLLIIQVSVFEAAFVDPHTLAASNSPYAQYLIQPARNAIDAFPLSPVIAAIIIILIASGGFFGLRIGIRRWWFHELSRDAHQLSFDIFTRLDEINNHVTEVCAKVRDRVGKGGSWPERARKWIAVALWNAKRGEYLDRFITTVIWKVQTSIQDIEDLSLWTKLALGVAAVVLAVSEAKIPSLAFGLFIFAQAFFLWHRLGMQSPDFWTIQFRKSAPADDHTKETYVDKISTVVENLVHEALSKEFGQGGKQA